MEDNQIRNAPKKGIIISVIFYILAVILLITALVSLAACHQNISAQLKQGVPVKGNELAIVNLYLTSCVQYFALAAAMIFCGSILRKSKQHSASEAEQNILCASNESIEIAGSSEPEPDEDDDSDFEEWGFQKQEK